MNSPNNPTDWCSLERAAAIAAIGHRADLLFSTTDHERFLAVPVCQPRALPGMFPDDTPWILEDVFDDRLALVYLPGPGDLFARS